VDTIASLRAQLAAALKKSVPTEAAAVDLTLPANKENVNPNAGAGAIVEESGAVLEQASAAPGAAPFGLAAGESQNARPPAGRAFGDTISSKDSVAAAAGGAGTIGVPNARKRPKAGYDMVPLGKLNPLPVNKAVSVVSAAAPGLDRIGSFSVPPALNANMAPPVPRTAIATAAANAEANESVLRNGIDRPLDRQLLCDSLWEVEKRMIADGCVNGPSLLELLPGMIEAHAQTTAAANRAPKVATSNNGIPPTVGVQKRIGAPPPAAAAAAVSQPAQHSGPQQPPTQVVSTATAAASASAVPNPYYPRDTTAAAHSQCIQPPYPANGTVQFQSMPSPPPPPPPPPSPLSSSSYPPSAYAYAVASPQLYATSTSSSSTSDRQTTHQYTSARHPRAAPQQQQPAAYSSPASPWPMPAPRYPYYGGGSSSSTGDVYAPGRLPPHPCLRYD